MQRKKYVYVLEFFIQICLPQALNIYEHKTLTQDFFAASKKLFKSKFKKERSA